MFFDGFSKLNTNGLFDNPDDAYSYMVKYLIQDWTKRGEYGIFEIYTKICTEFFPQSSTYEYGNGIELEVYPSADAQNPDYSCEIWIAVNEKK